MTPEEFLNARIIEVEDYIKDKGFEISHDEFMAIANLAQSMRETLKLHQQWPILVSEETDFEFEQVDIDNFAYVATQKFIWMTNEEYKKRFGTEPPTSNMIKSWLRAYVTHKDFDRSWL
jgi:hypothetical protein